MAIRFGMSKREYFHSTPYDVDIFIEEKSKERKEHYEREDLLIDYTAWLHGVYVSRAVAAVLNGRKSPYPKQPLGQKDKNRIVATEDMTDAEKDEITSMFFGNLQEMQKSFEHSHKADGA